MKESIPLIDKGYDVHLITEKVTQYSERFTTVTTYQHGQQLYDAIRLHADADLFHCHNEPSWFVTTVKDVGMKQPVVLDMHDSNLLRKTPEEQEAELQHNPQSVRVSVDERNNAQLADAIVYPCEPMRQIVGGEFKLTQPSVVIPSAIPEEFYRFDFDNWIGGLVYEGRIDSPDDLPPRWRSLFQYANYIELAKKCHDINMDFHIYTPRQNEAVLKKYHEANAIMHPPENVGKLIKRMGSHDWGLVGNLHKHTEWQHALPNKLFEYMGGCVPVVAMNADESAKLLLEHGLGIAVENVDELAQRWREHRACRPNVVKKRFEFAMERYTPKLEALYKELL
jgi:hypothetical protein